MHCTKYKVRVHHREPLTQGSYISCRTIKVTETNPISVCLSRGKMFRAKADGETYKIPSIPSSRRLPCWECPLVLILASNTDSGNLSPFVWQLNVTTKYLGRY